MKLKNVGNNGRKRCPECGFKNESDTKFCIKCGMRFVEKRCSNCDTLLLDDDVFCTNCGAKVDAEDICVTIQTVKTEKSDLPKEKSELKIHMNSDNKYDNREPVSPEVKSFFNKPSSL